MNSPNPPAVLTPDDRQDLQGFVTSGFGHLPAAAYLFLAFRNPFSARRWLKDLLPHVTTARSWRHHPRLPKSKPTRTLNLAFTPAGLQTLGLPSTALQSFPGEFLQGMAFEERSRILGDTGDDAPDQWQLGGPRNRPLHAIALLHAISREALDHDRALLLDACTIQQVDIVAEEFGVRPDDDREPFGFRDGIAQPRIEGIHGNGVRTGEFILGYPNEYGYVPVGPRLEAGLDPAGMLPTLENPHQPGYKDLGRNGTYLVYRKLEQHVARFWQFIALESGRLRGEATPDTMTWLAAKLMGRWPGGTPLTLSPESDDPKLAMADDFLYAERDGVGQGCPIGAHIRRMNPRDHLPPAGPVESLQMTARHRILRRGRPYGIEAIRPSFAERLKGFLESLASGSLPNGTPPCGLHFLCLNASIKRQFEFLQQAWANNPQFGGLSRNPDPIIGHRANDTPPCMRIPDSRLEWRTSALPRFITVRGGAYFFMPGLRALRYLAAAPAPE